MEDEREEAVELRDELEVTASVMQVIINKLDQFIEGEITRDEYQDWVDNHYDELFSELDI